MSKTYNEEIKEFFVEFDQKLFGEGKKAAQEFLQAKISETRKLNSSDDKQNSVIPISFYRSLSTILTEDGITISEDDADKGNIGKKLSLSRTRSFNNNKLTFLVKTIDDLAKDAHKSTSSFNFIQSTKKPIDLLLESDEDDRAIIDSSFFKYLQIARDLNNYNHYKIFSKNNLYDNKKSDYLLNSKKSINQLLEKFPLNDNLKAIAFYVNKEIVQYGKKIGIDDNEIQSSYAVLEELSQDQNFSSCLVPERNGVD